MTPDQSHAQVARGQFSERWIATVVEVLASSGIGVFADAAAGAPVQPVKEPASPLRLLRWQARNLALEASAGGGVSGQELESLTRLPAGPRPSPTSWRPTSAEATLRVPVPPRP